MDGSGPSRARTSRLNVRSVLRVFLMCYHGSVCSLHSYPQPADLEPFIALAKDVPHAAGSAAPLPPEHAPLALERLDFLVEPSDLTRLTLEEELVCLQGLRERLRRRRRRAVQGGGAGGGIGGREKGGEMVVELLGGREEGNKVSAQTEDGLKEPF